MDVLHALAIVHKMALRIAPFTPEEARALEVVEAQIEGREVERLCHCNGPTCTCFPEETN